MPPTVTRELKITYGAFVVGGVTDRQIDSYTSHELGYDIASAEFSFVIQKTDEDDFATEIALVEAAFRTPRLDLLVEQGAETILSLSHAGGTGFDSYPKIIKRENLKYDSGRSRRYTIRIEFGMPADNVGTSGRRWSKVNVAFGPQRRRIVTLSGTYTMLGGTLARAQYTASIDAYSAAVLAAFGGTFELVEEPTTEINSTDRTIDFTIIFKEVFFPQAGAALDDPEIVDQVFKMRRGEIWPGDTPTVNRVTRINVTYSCWLDKDLSTDLVGKWDNVIKPFILKQIRTGFSLTALAVVEESPEFFFDDNSISATMVVLAAPKAGFLSNRVETEDTRIPGAELVGAWTGNPRQKYSYQGFEVLQRKITQVVEVLGDFEPSPFVTPTPHGSLLGLKFIVRSEQSNKTPLTRGKPPDTYKVTEVRKTTTIELYAPLGASTLAFGGGGGEPGVIAPLGGGGGGPNPGPGG